MRPVWSGLVLALALVRPSLVFGESATLFSSDADTAASTAAPSASSVLRGRVLDPLKMPIAGARLTVVSDGQTEPIVAQTDQTGSFATAVPAGRVMVTVSADGFRDRVERL